MPIWAQIFVPVLTAVLTLIATTVTTHFLGGPKRRQEQREQDVKAITDKIEDLKKDINTKLDEQSKNYLQLKDDMKLMKKGIQYILKNDLRSYYNEYLELGWASVDTKEELESLYRIYHNLGANGVMDHLRELFMKLPDKAPQKPKSTKQ